jgi:hypothetical protein
MKKNKYAQSSLEFLIIFGISFAIIAIIGGLFYSYFDVEKKTLDNEQLQKIGDEMVNYVEKVYFLGDGNRLTIDTKFPKGIKNITIHHLINHTLSDGTNASFEYLNITFYHSDQIVHNIFSPAETYIRFNCTNCTHNSSTNISYFDADDYAEGHKKIRFESKGDWVAINFPKK